MPTDRDFETKLHSLVYPQISSRAPRLIKSMIGFELLDVNDEETEATAVYIFRIGEQLLYVPVFYDNGKVLGLNLMYLENEDLFVPLQESWIDFLHSRQNFVLGRVPGKKEQVEETPAPVFDTLTPTFGKLASRDDKGMDGVVANRFRSKPYQESEERCDLETLCDRFEFPKAAMATVLHTIKADDEFGRAFLRFYPMEKLAIIADKLENKQREPSDEPVGETGIAETKRVLVFTSDDDAMQGVGISESDQDELRRTGVAVKDPRDPKDVTKAYRTSTPRTWFAPRGTGVYNLVQTDGDIVKAMVSKDIITVGDGSARGYVVVADDKAGGFFDVDALLATDELAPQEWERMYKELSDVGSTKLSRHDDFVIVNGSQKTTLILEFIGQVTDEDGNVTLYVRQDGYPESRRGDYDCVPCSPGYAHSTYGGRGLVDRAGVEMDDRDKPTPFLHRWVERDIAKGEKTKKEVREFDYEDGRKVVILKDTDNDVMQTAGDTLYVGSQCKLIKIERKPSTLVAPSLQNLWPLLTKMGTQRLTITADRGEYEIARGIIKSGRITKVGALKHLILVHGLSKDAACYMLKMADATEAGSRELVTWALKYAAPYPNLEGTIMPPATEQVTETQEGVGSAIANEGQEPFLARDIQQAMRAATTGQKSVFDTAVLTSLLRKHDIGSSIDELLSDITIGMDRIGRLLFLLYAHWDQFAERYGEEDLPELEDALDNLLKELGETLLFLQRESVQEQVGETGGLGLVTT